MEDHGRMWKARLQRYAKHLFISVISSMGHELRDFRILLPLADVDSTTEASLHLRTEQNSTINDNPNSSISHRKKNWIQT